MRSFRSLIRAVTLSATLCVAVPAPVAAQEPRHPQPLFVAPVLHPPAVQVQPFPEPVAEPKRPAPLIPLYTSLAVLQGLDIHSTSRGLASGGYEANPVMEPIVDNRTAFVVLKTVTTAGVILASEKLWKKNRRAAVVMTALTNIGLFMVVANNYRAQK
jgi:hypothetical protein